MKEILIDELKEIQLGVLDSVAEYCESNHLKYFLAYGTLIGAVRHNGYIPWDDDIDIIMPRPDYDIFLKNFNERNAVDSQIIQAIDKSINPCYTVPFAKAYDTRTYIDETMYKKKDLFGVYIDIFPLDGFVDINMARRILRYNKYLNTKNAILDHQRSFTKNLVMAVGKVILSFTSVSSIIDKMQQAALRYRYEDCTMVNSLYSPYCLKEACPKALLEKTIFAKFEGRDYRIPENYDSYLRNIYGDYMQLPPLEKRVTHHTFKAWWK